MTDNPAGANPPDEPDNTPEPGDAPSAPESHADTAAHLSAPSARREAHAATWDGTDRTQQAQPDTPARETTDHHHPIRYASHTPAENDHPEQAEADPAAEQDQDPGDTHTAENHTPDTPASRSSDGAADDHDQRAVTNAGMEALRAEFDAKYEQQEARFEARLEQQKADFEAKMERQAANHQAEMMEVRAEVQAIKDMPQARPDGPDGTKDRKDLPHPVDRELTVGERNSDASERKDDRPGLLSNAKSQLYATVGGLAAGTLIDHFVPGMSRVVEDIIVGSPPVIGALVPTLREGWRRSRDDSPNKP